MIVVNIEDSRREGFEKGIMLFKRKVDNVGIIEEYKERQYFTKPSLLKRQRRLKNAKYKGTDTR